jgi:hypothetical protein
MELVIGTLHGCLVSSLEIYYIFVLRTVASLLMSAEWLGFQVCYLIEHDALDQELDQLDRFHLSVPS